MSAQAAGFSGSYDPGDVTFLLTPLDLETVPVAEKERQMRSGQRHYSELLSTEAAPSPAYLAAYHRALSANGARLAGNIAALAAALVQRRCGPRGLALASFARAGTPIGVLLARALTRLGAAPAHYSISIIRDRGIDPAALAYIAARHDPADIVFVDGWTGKGAIAHELRGSVQLPALGIAPYLVVIADPAGQADLAATGEDYLIPSGILNGIVSGLVSRSVLPAELAPGQFHGCRILHELAPHDLSRAFVETIDALVTGLPAAVPALWQDAERRAYAQSSTQTIARLRAEYGVANLNRIKPGLAEATRAVLRRSPRFVLATDPGERALAHLAVLCAERQVRLHAAGDLGPYRAVVLLD